MLYQLTNFAFLQKYQRLQYSIDFDELIDVNFAIIGYSKIDTSSYYNLALTNNTLNDKQILQIEGILTSKNRKPTIYFENNDKMKKLSDKLTVNGYKKSYEDCWQFWNDKEIDNKHFNFVKKVSNPKDLELFSETFNNCYQKDDPQNSYGQLGKYLTVAKKAWFKHHKTNRLEYFMVYKGNKPVSVSSLTNFEGIGYISNVGSLRSVRGEGYGKAATLYCVAESIQRENRLTCLATEEGKYPDLFYKRIGFYTKFKAIGYSK